MEISFYKHDTYPDKILVRDFFGKVDVETIIESWNYLLDNELLTQSHVGVINNLLGCELQMNFDSFQTLLNFLKSKRIFRKLRLAVICHNPENIVFPTIGEFEEKELKIKPFTTEDSAINWILYS